MVELYKYTIYIYPQERSKNHPLLKMGEKRTDMDVTDNDVDIFRVIQVAENVKVRFSIVSQTDQDSINSDLSHDYLFDGDHFYDDGDSFNDFSDHEYM